MRRGVGAGSARAGCTSTLGRLVILSAAEGTSAAGGKTFMARAASLGKSRSGCRRPEDLASPVSQTRVAS